MCTPAAWPCRAVRSWVRALRRFVSARLSSPLPQAESAGHPRASAPPVDSQLTAGSILCAAFCGSPAMPFAGSGGRADAGRAIAVRVQSDNDKISRSSAGRISGKQPPPTFSC
jgi:hypothetical protein